MAPDHPRAVAAEAIGTALLVATVVGSGIMAAKLAAGNAAIALLANAIATGAMLVVLITVLAQVSGAHFNPMVSLVMWRRGTLSGALVVPFVIAQICGGCAGAMLANAMFDLPVVQISGTARGGAGQWIAEAVATFGLVGTILGTLRARPDFVPVAVGLYITGAYWFTSSTSFANPAVTVARTLSDTFAGISPRDITAFIAMQSLGAIAGHYFWRWLLEPERDM